MKKAMNEHDEKKQKCDEATGKRHYPKEFIDWLHGMSDKAFTDRMYARWQKEIQSINKNKER